MPPSVPVNKRQQKTRRIGYLLLLDVPLVIVTYYDVFLLLLFLIFPFNLTIDFQLPPKKPIQSYHSRLSTRFDPTTRSYTHNVLSYAPHSAPTSSREHSHKHSHTHTHTHPYTQHQPYLNYELSYMLERRLLYREATSTA